MLGPNTPDYDFYYSLLKSDPNKGIEALEGILKSPKLMDELINNVGGMTVLFDINNGGNSQELFDLLADSVYYQDLIVQFLKIQDIDVESVEELLHDTVKVNQCIESGTFETLMKISQFRDKVLNDQEFITSVGNDEDLTNYVLSTAEIFDTFSKSPYFNEMINGEVISQKLSEMNEEEIVRYITLLPGITDRRNRSGILQLLNFRANPDGNSGTGIYDSIQEIAQNTEALKLLSYQDDFYLWMGLLDLGSRCYQYEEFQDFIFSDKELFVRLEQQGNGTGLSNILGQSESDDDLFIRILDIEGFIRSILEDHQASSRFKSTSYETKICRCTSKVLGLTTPKTTAKEFLADDELWEQISSNDLYLMFLSNDNCMDALITSPTKLATYFEDPEVLKVCRASDSFDTKIRTMSQANVISCLTTFMPDIVSESTLTAILSKEEDRQKILENECARQLLLYNQYGCSAIISDSTIFADFNRTKEEIEDNMTHYQFMTSIWSCKESILLDTLKNYSEAPGEYTTFSEFLESEDFVTYIVDNEDQTLVNLLGNNKASLIALRNAETDEAGRSFRAWCQDEKRRSYFFEKQTITGATNDSYSISESVHLKLISYIIDSEITSTTVLQLIQNADEWSKVEKSEAALEMVFQNSAGINSIFGNNSYITLICKNYNMMRKAVESYYFYNILSSSTNGGYVNTAMNSTPELAKAMCSEKAFYRLCRNNNALQYINNSNFYKSVGDSPTDLKIALQLPNYNVVDKLVQSKNFFTSLNENEELLSEIFLGRDTYSHYFYNYIITDNTSNMDTTRGFINEFPNIVHAMGSSPRCMHTLFTHYASSDHSIKIFDEKCNFAKNLAKEKVALAIVCDNSRNNNSQKFLSQLNDCDNQTKTLETNPDLFSVEDKTLTRGTNSEYSLPIKGIYRLVDSNSNTTCTVTDDTQNVDTVYVGQTESNSWGGNKLTVKPTRTDGAPEITNYTINYKVYSLAEL